MTLVVRTRAELERALTADAPRAGRSGGDVLRGLVMTMGALHAGHIALVDRARQECGVVVVSIFVNPLQFGAGEDLDRYPRTLDADVALLEAAGVDVVYAPDVEAMYPGGEPLVRVAAGELGERLEGAVRPGHFDGMLTVVLKLLQQVHPDVSYFGQKDAQQLALIRRMVFDLDVPARIEAVPIVRDADGLALSSRNIYLSDDDRRAALALSRAMAAGELAASEGASAVRLAALAELGDVQLDYLALVDPGTLLETDDAHEGPALLLVAARFGSTRLIDNTPLVLVPATSKALS